ncbi:MAG: hypothetical protein WD055_06070 [Candidatus Dependentiae bacterium]
MISSLAAMMLLSGNTPPKPKIVPEERMVELKQWQEQDKEYKKKRAEYLTNKNSETPARSNT